MARTLKISPNDTIMVALAPLKKGEVIEGVILLEDIKVGHKFSLKDIKKDENIIKYGFPIGHAKSDIAAGSWVHVHNMKTNLTGTLDYIYQPEFQEINEVKEIPNVEVYQRKFDQYGIRNELYIVPLVGCVNGQAELIKSKLLNEVDCSNIDGVTIMRHPYGCSQMGEDNLFTRNLLQKIVKHPNAGGVLVLALGCENNQLEPFIESLGEYDNSRVKFLKAQSVEDEVASGFEICQDLIKMMSLEKRVTRPLSVINVGLKCGGSDGFSGITANPLVGMFSDYIIACHGASVLSEVPEMFGAEQVLMRRAKDEATFEKIVKLINDFKEYYEAHNQVCYENPSPGNKEGGITTLEEKSLGCVQKAGLDVVQDVLFDEDFIHERGLNLLKGPGNDMVACTNLGAAGCHLILFTTGRGTPFGGFVPTIKISTNSMIAEHKNNWIDFNAGAMLEEEVSKVFLDFRQFIIDVINGKIKTKNEQNGFKEIAIFKDGVTL